jgi:hypothetical protein
VTHVSMRWLWFCNSASLRHSVLAEVLIWKCLWCQAGRMSLPPQELL